MRGLASLFSDIHFEKGEFTFPVVVALIAVALTTLPVVYGYIASTEENRFVGYINDPVDQNTYLSWMKQANDGNLSFEEKFTTERNPKNIVILYFLCGGIIGRILKVPLPIVLELMRIGSAFIMLGAVYCFISYFLKVRIARRVAFSLVAFSAGFGAYAVTLRHLGFSLPAHFVPMDQNLPELVTFLTIMFHGHVCLATAFIVTIFLFILHSIETRDPSLAVGAGILAVILALFHPYDIVTISVVLGAYVAVLAARRDRRAWRAFAHCALFAAVSSPGIGYQYYVVQSNPAVKAWSAYRYPPYGDALTYVCAFGVIFIAAVLGIWKAARERNGRFYFLIVWVVTISVFIYYPFVFFQRHAAVGIHIPFCILASEGILSVTGGLLTAAGDRARRSGIVVIAAVILFASPTNIMHMRAQFLRVYSRQFPVFLPKDLVDAFSWLDSHLAPESVVLASKAISNFIPSHTGSRVYIGHWAETANRREKEEAVSAFMNASSGDMMRKRLLAENGISYFVYTDADKAAGDFDPDRATYLSKVFENRSVRIYEVTHT